MDAIRKQLDVLMGANRNGDFREVDRKYFDCDVCRLFHRRLFPSRSLPTNGNHLSSATRHPNLRQVSIQPLWLSVPRLAVVNSAGRTFAIRRSPFRCTVKKHLSLPATLRSRTTSTAPPFHSKPFADNYVVHLQ
ncbi:hypothetical protein KSP39_PZI005586 [Platanthera zijinensis]|uniref:Uncharacterized protein n=1 Tax=Platanthera zijinensis TaxID=2320716 RepID=A0AAP0BRC8_9ASPA